MPIFQLNENIVFPPPDLAETNGLIAIGGDLSPERLIAAYRLGIFPWFSNDGPILWWFTSPRLVLYPDELKVPRRLRREIKKDLFTITFDNSFPQVIKACADIHQQTDEKTWITDEMIKSYIKLHERGYAHSVECWQGDQLAGGLYGVALGGIFFGESMFTKITNSSKICFVKLVERLKNNNFRLIDCQMTTQHLLQFGTREISGSTFQKELKISITNLSTEGAWHDDISINNG